jgi:hypothetical protein
MFPVPFEDQTMIKPTVGRVVWYYPPGKQAGVDQPLAALIAYVWSDMCVNLAIFDGNGQPYPPGHTSILLVQEGTPVPSGGNYCTWMPYQMGQAAKAEELQKKLAQVN